MTHSPANQRLVQWLPLALVAAGAFALRAYLWRYHPVMVPDYDGAEYLVKAANVLGGGGPVCSIFIPPGFPALLGVFLPLFDSPQAAGMFVSSLFGAVLCVPVYLVASGLFGRPAGYLSAFMVAVNAHLAVVSTWVMAEMPYAFLLYMGIHAALVYARGGGVRASAVMGALFGAAYLFRPEAMLLLPAVMAVAAVVAWRDGREKGLGGLKGLLPAAAVFMLISAPYLIYLRGELGVWSISGKVGYNLLKGVAATGGLEAFADKYAAGLVRLAHELGRAFHPAVLVLAVAGAAASLYRIRAHPAGFLLPAALAGFTLCLPLFTVDMRILSPYYPAVIIWAASGVCTLSGALSRLPRLGRVMAYRPAHLAAALFVLASGALTLGAAYGSARHEALRAFLSERYLDTGRWLTHYASPGDAALSRELLLVFYSGVCYKNLPDLPPEGLWRYARESGSAFVVVDDSCLAKRRALGPLLYPLMGRSNKVPGFSLVYVNPTLTVIVYEVVEP